MYRILRIIYGNLFEDRNLVNNVLFDEITLAATTAIQTAATAVYELPLNIALPPGYRILTTLGTVQSAGGGWFATAIGGSYTAI